ncbi:PREDICTED: pyridine nucleotide-disulfide oxidoreductase domain-containing protein 1 [Ceratosolen solmsi marchali]|uniref:Pyridine nucleotide-disulfide oxidoreductase domain-containing protein 1 n=1 Tax=Ceratosolen solmsi marchali TaxID=326594 RepID=A0AAJ7E399_9HYME|nr:PREDICTED: pyridine nucleotide-disulfide oxidoreductase domain-containing protein 1 [Ceratosolen solmsi marchali]
MNNMEATFVIIGGGISGVSCAESIAFLAPKESVILITASPLIKSITNVLPFGQTLTQFDVEECVTESLNSTHPTVTVIKDVVVRVEKKKNSVITEKGKVIIYKKLCICTGARSKLIFDNSKIIGIRDTESLENFLEKLRSAKKIIVIGNGGIAIELVHEINGVDIVWVIKDKHISATFVDPGAAEFFQEKLSKTNLDVNNQITKRIKYTVSKDESKVGGSALGPDWRNNIELNVNVSRFEQTSVQVEYECEVLKLIDPSEIPSDNDREKWPIYAQLSNGKIIGCDFIVSATGVTPNSNIPGLESVKRAKDGGYVVDSNMETSEKNIYAAGDVCTVGWEIAFHWFQMRLWTQAFQMGRYAAKAMVSMFKGEDFFQDFCFELFTHVTKFFGYKVILLGLFNGQKLDNEYEILLRVTKGREYVKLILKNGKMQGAVLIGETDLEEVCENLILNQLDLSAYGEDFLNPDIDIEDYFD